MISIWKENKKNYVFANSTTSKPLRIAKILEKSTAQSNYLPMIWLVNKMKQFKTNKVSLYLKNIGLVKKLPLFNQTMSECPIGSMQEYCNRCTLGSRS